MQLKLQNGHIAVAFVVVTAFAVRTVFAQAQSSANSVLGAMSDEPAKIVSIDGQQVKVFKSARYKLDTQRNPNSGVWYYSVPPQISRDASGNIDARVFPSLASAGESVLQIRLAPSTIDVSKLLAAVKQNQIDPYAISASKNLLPLYLYSMEFGLLDATASLINRENPTPFVDPIDIKFRLPSSQAQAALTALKQGASLQVTYTTLVKLSTLDETTIKWNAITKTNTFRRYFGPSGPDFITAAQTMNIVSDVLSELKVSHWIEREQGGAHDVDYAEYTKKLVDRFLTNKERREIDLAKWLDTQRFQVPVDKFQSLVDETRKVAIDAKQLNNAEWCKKYSDELKQHEETAQERSKGAGGAFNFSYGPLSFGASGNESSTSSSRKSQIEKARKSEDCGKNLVERTFKYDFDGVKYVPKSIYVYEKNKAAGTLSDSEDFLVYRTTQRIGRDEWSVRAK